MDGNTSAIVTLKKPDFIFKTIASFATMAGRKWTFHNVIVSVAHYCWESKVV